MKILVEALPELLGALGSTGLISAVAWCLGRRRASRQAAPQPSTEHRTIRRYTLLGTTNRAGGPVQMMSTRPAGAVLVWPVGDRQERFELTDIQLVDGTFAAEPVDRFEKIR